MITGEGMSEGTLSPGTIRSIVADGLAALPLEGKRVLVIIPDGTRSMPMAMMFDLFTEFLVPRVRKLDYLVALGTHRPMDDEQLGRLVGRQVVDGRVGEIHIYNHQGRNEESLATIGTLPADEIHRITGGLLLQEVPVQINRRIFDYDQVIICGPVFPHEVVGFSGGNKYLFPGIAGSAIINFTHWLGALITSYKVIGTLETPIREVIERAAALVSVPTACCALVVTHAGVAGMYFGAVKEAWQAAARISQQRHIIYKDRTYQRVLSIMPEMYDDLWTAAKGMYKLEPVVADGGEVVIYAPHICEVSYTYGAVINEIGYHCRDFFLTQWDRYRDYPGGILAHLTHLKGLGIYDPETGTESPRIRVTLATGIPPERCAQINLGYLPPAEVDISAWQGRENEGILVVPQAGEMLYRLRTGGV